MIWATAAVGGAGEASEPPGPQSRREVLDAFFAEIPAAPRPPIRHDSRSPQTADEPGAVPLVQLACVGLALDRTFQRPLNRRLAGGLRNK